jgi:RNA polymerase sigma-70 factor, ECF subfamily
MPGQSGIGFEVIFNKHFADIYGYVAFRLAPDTHAAQDLTQDVFVAGFKAWSTFRGESTPLQWLRAIARRMIADHFKQQRACASMEAIPVQPGNAGDSTAQEQAEMLSAVLRAIAPEDAELLEEKYLEGLSVHEMAGRHGKTEKAIESALSRTRALVRAKIQCFQTHMER